MSVEHVPGKPRIGSIVHYYNPKIVQRVGLASGYDGRGDGPYAAIVTNNIGNGLTVYVLYPDWAPITYRNLPEKTAYTPNSEHGYWDWASPLDKARAAKDTKDAGSSD